MTKLYLKILSFIFIFVFLLGCSQNANNQNILDTKDEMSSSNERSNEMPTNQINAWTDGCEIAMEFAGDNTIWALDSKTIKYSKINDSVFEIIYPKEPTIIKNINIQTIGNLTKRVGVATFTGITKGIEHIKKTKISLADPSIFPPFDSRERRGTKRISANNPTQPTQPAQPTQHSQSTQQPSELNNKKQNAVKFGQTYTKIEDVFGTFKKEILDFEQDMWNR